MAPAAHRRQSAVFCYGGPARGARGPRPPLPMVGQIPWRTGWCGSSFTASGADIAISRAIIYARRNGSMNRDATSAVGTTQDSPHSSPGTRRPDEYSEVGSAMPADPPTGAAVTVSARMPWWPLRDGRSWSLRDRRLGCGHPKVGQSEPVPQPRFAHRRAMRTAVRPPECGPTEDHAPLVTRTGPTAGAADSAGQEVGGPRRMCLP